MDQGLPTGSGSLAPVRTSDCDTLTFSPAPAKPGEFRPAGAQRLAIEKAVSRGGQAQVVKARTQNGTPVALKIFESAQDAALEWNTLVKFDNFKVLPKAFSLGSVSLAGGEERPCLIEEWIEGETLATRLNRDGALSVEDALRAMGDVVAFLATAESALREGVVHHDVKPQNIIAASDGGIRLIDFGVSELAFSVPGRAYGTQGFAAPEWFFSQASSGRNSDSYSVAATLLALLAGENRPPAYGVVLDDAGALRYDAAWTDEYESELMESSAAPFSGFVRDGRTRRIYLSETSFGAFEHDGETVSRLEREISETLSNTYGAHATSEEVQLAASAALAAFDAKLRSAFAACLSISAESRPTMRQLQNALPRDDESYIHELRMLGVNAALGGGRILSNDGPTFEDGTLAQALDSFNTGCYERAIRGFHDLARRGNPSAKYYLAVCIRDSLGNSAASYNEADLMQMMGESAAQGAVVALFWLGQALYAGSFWAQGTQHRIERNAELGLSYIRRAASDDAEAGKEGFPPAKAWLSEQGLA